MGHRKGNYGRCDSDPTLDIVRRTHEITTLVNEHYIEGDRGTCDNRSDLKEEEDDRTALRAKYAGQSHTNRPHVR